MGIKWEFFDEYMQRPQNTFFMVCGYIFHYLLFLPAKIIVIGLMILKAL